MQVVDILDTGVEDKTTGSRRYTMECICTDDLPIQDALKFPEPARYNIHCLCRRRTLTSNRSRLSSHPRLQTFSVCPAVIPVISTSDPRSSASGKT